MNIILILLISIFINFLYIFLFNIIFLQNFTILNNLCQIITFMYRNVHNKLFNENEYLRLNSKYISG